MKGLGHVPFRQPIVGGAGALIIPAITSDNYVAGVSGWTLNRDGTMELSNLTARSDLIINDIPTVNGTYDFSMRRYLDVKQTHKTAMDYLTGLTANQTINSTSFAELTELRWQGVNSGAGSDYIYDDDDTVFIRVQVELDVTATVLATGTFVMECEFWDDNFGGTPALYKTTTEQLVWKANTVGDRAHLTYSTSFSGPGQGTVYGSIGDGDWFFKFNARSTVLGSDFQVNRLHSKAYCTHLATSFIG